MRYEARMWDPSEAARFIALVKDFAKWLFES